MTSWSPDLSARKGPRYEALAAAIAEAVRTGELEAGVKLPPQRELAWKLGVTVGTIGRAYALAEQRRLVSGQVGRGTYVLAPAPAEPAIAPAPSGGALDLTRNTPPAGDQAAALAQSLQELSRHPAALETLLSYTPEAGHRAHRRAGGQWIGRVGLEAPESRIIVTGGAQHALAATLLSLVRPGDTVLTEHMTYGGVGNALRLGGARPVGVAIDEEGALPEAIDRAARETGARLVFLTPTIHSPTTALMGENRRRAIAEVLRARDLILVEDDVYGYIPRRRPAPIAALAPDHVIYVASASKCLAVGLRVAWVVAPSALKARLAETIYAMALAQPAINAEIATRWIDDGTADRIVATIRAEMAERHAIATEALRGLSWRGRPDALHGFIELPESRRADDVAEEAQRRGILLCPAGSFAVDDAPVPNAFRVTLGSPPDRATLRRALDTIVAIVGSPSASDAETLRRHIV
ncbi:MAG: PLP-dependent aminotransferase family protein [Alphaproteobacteria bacterium]|nr:PLP-dependent aminotransferase family protein [Alphaproteobacteria bacterium]